MLALDAVKQIDSIEEQVSACLQVLAECQENPETIGFIMGALCRVYVLIQEPDLPVDELDSTVYELWRQVRSDRNRNREERAIESRIKELAF